MTVEQQRLVESRVGLVGGTAKRFSAKYPMLGYDEFFSEGSLGLVRAAKRYDGTRGVDFGAFAMRAIAGAMMDRVRDDAARRKTLSLDEEVRGGDTLGELVGANDPAPTFDRDSEWNELLSPLSRRERRILSMLAREGLSARDVGKIEGIGPCQVRRIVNDAGELLKKTTLAHVATSCVRGERPARHPTPDP